MIDIVQETLITIREAPRRLPTRPDGKRLHVSAFYRWISRGVRGVRLEPVRIGGSTYTSLEALQRFADRLAVRADPHAPPALPATRTRQMQINRASNRLRDELGLGNLRRAPARSDGPPDNDAPECRV